MTVTGTGHGTDQNGNPYVITQVALWSQKSTSQPSVASPNPSGPGSGWTLKWTSYAIPNCSPYSATWNLAYYAAGIFWYVGGTQDDYTLGTPNYFFTSVYGSYYTD